VAREKRLASFPSRYRQQCYLQYFQKRFFSRKSRKVELLLPKNLFQSLRQKRRKRELRGKSGLSRLQSFQAGSRRRGSVSQGRAEPKYSSRAAGKATPRQCDLEASFARKGRRQPERYGGNAAAGGAFLVGASLGLLVASKPAAPGNDKTRRRPFLPPLEVIARCPLPLFPLLFWADSHNGRKERLPRGPFSVRARVIQMRPPFTWTGRRTGRFAGWEGNCCVVTCGMTPSACARALAADLPSAFTARRRKAKRREATLPPTQAPLVGRKERERESRRATEGNFS